MGDESFHLELGNGDIPTVWQSGAPGNDEGRVIGIYHFVDEAVIVRVIANYPEFEFSIQQLGRYFTW